jgi:acetyl esterase/lipase
MHAFVLRYTTYYQEWVSDFMNPPAGNEASKHPQPLLDLAKAILTIRENAEEFHVDPDKIIVCGFSAGGHLAASLGVHWESELLRETFGRESSAFKPNALILGYPLLDYPTMKELNAKSDDPMIAGLFRQANQALFGNPDPSDEELVRLSPSRHVTASTPPTFLWHTAADSLVYVANSLLFAQELAKHGVPFDLHVFEQGVHGLSLCDETTEGEPAHLDSRGAAWVDLALSWLKLRF